MIRIIGLGLVTAVASYLGVAVILSWARRRQLLDIPNDRSSHSVPTPHGGGLMMVVVTVTGVLLLSWSSGELSSLWWYLAGGVLIALVSWWDDLHNLPSLVRFAFHGAGTALAVAGFGYWPDASLPFVSGLGLGWLGLALTIVWIIGLTNAFNFMDGIDGIAGLQSVIAGSAWFILGWWSGQSAIWLIGLLVLSSSAGFLGHNWSPARIFMGDVGSAFLGYTFAVLPLMAAKTGPARSRFFLTGVLIMWPFVFDTALTLCRRAMRGENILAAHRSHLYQRLVIIGWPHWLVTPIYGLLAVLAAAAALNWQFQGPAAEWMAAGALVGLSSAIWLFTIGQERRHAANIAGPGSLVRERP